MKPPEPRITVYYHLQCGPDEVEALSRDLAFEQTVEMPESLVADASIRERIVGRVESIEALTAPRPCFHVSLSYDAELSGYHLPQLLNLVYGNISLKKGIRLVGMDWPEAFLERFPGPRFGIEGVRAEVGVYGRPLLATALKPRGLSGEEFARMAYAFCAGGGDIVKDDHNLAEESFEAFQDRVSRCQRAVEEANARTGRRALYFPNLSAPADRLEARLTYALQQGVRGVLVSPFVLGLEAVRLMAESYPLIVMAHPSFTGAYFHDPTHGIEPGVLLGQVFRLIGTDISIYPNTGGRFTFTSEDCHRINFHLRCPLGKLKSAFPAPAGGMQYSNLDVMAREYGEDVVYLIGSALLRHSENLEASTRAFLDKVREHFTERLETPRLPCPPVSCESIPGAPPQRVLERLGFREEFSWEGREDVAYKTSQELPFQDVRRVELIGRGGEATDFELRYFEIGPGGFTSLEKHAHTHTLVAVRGRGVLLRGEQRESLAVMDVVYIPPMQVHQLRNESDQPFGFFCIVDRVRDRPQSP